MKMLIQLTGLVIGLYLGLYKPLEKPRPAWWQWTFVAMLTLTVVLALAPKTAGTFADAVLVFRAAQANQVVPVKARLLHETGQYDAQNNEYAVQMTDFREGAPTTALVRFRGSKPEEISDAQAAQTVVVNVARGGSDGVFVAYSIASVNPFVTLPFIPQLEERARNLYFHVPMSWVGILAYLMAMVYGYQYLKTKKVEYDIKSSSAAALGTLFTLLATLTGMIWAQFNWGVAWNWDPRETSIFILLMLYFAYFGLRQAVDGEERRARLAAVYVIFAFLPAVFLMFIVPRVMDGLHPGSGNDSNAGPLLSSQPDALNLIKQVIFSLSFGAFTMLYFWMLSLHVRVKNLRAASHVTE
jgi:heme exporter protein C